jgi:signal transduction histidine kinase
LSGPQSSGIQGGNPYRFGGRRRNDDTELGLATCKKIVGQQGGDILCQSRVSKGGSLFLTLLVRRQDAAS